MKPFLETELPLFYDEEMLEKRLKIYIKWNWEQFPHIISSGSTGAGKSYANAIIAARISKHIPNSRLFILDYKAQDYAYARGCKNLFEYQQVVEGLQIFYEEFKEKLEGKNTDRTFSMIIIEELSSVLSSLSKKEEDAVKSMITQLIFMGRSYNTHVLLSSQRPDSSLFGAGVRDSLNAVLWVGGGLSPQAKKMIADGFEERLNKGKRRGTGYFILNGYSIYDVVVPMVKNIETLQNLIIEALSR